MIRICDYPQCSHEAQFLMGWDNKNDKHFGQVCATHDRELGRRNLVNAGMPLNEAIAFEKYLFLTVNDASPIDWPEWFVLRTGKAPTPLTPKRTFPSDPVTLLSLSPRIQNTLRRNNIVTVNQLANMSDRELLKIRTMGKIGLSEIHKCLEEYVDE